MTIVNSFDPLYGNISLPSLIADITSCPEILRLREVRMSSMDLFIFPTFSNISRYEHAIGTAFLATKVANKWRLKTKDKLEIVAAALLHDVAAPAFSHLTESVFKENYNFDHEIESAKIILGKTSEFRKTTAEPIFAGEFPKARLILKRNNLDLHKIFDYLTGRGVFGKLIKGTIDIDNIDNVFRAAYHMGIPFEIELPLEIALGFKRAEDEIEYDFERSNLINKWLETRGRLYHKILLNTYDFCREGMLKYALRRTVKFGLIAESNWKLTDQELISRLIDSRGMSSEGKEISQIINRIRLGDIFTELGVFWITDDNVTNDIKTRKDVIPDIEKKLSALLGVEVTTHHTTDKRSRRITNIRAGMDSSLFKEKDFLDLGVNSRNMLLGIYTPQRTIVKRGPDGKAILDRQTRKQIKFDKSEIRGITLNWLRNYFSSQSIVCFSEEVLGCAP